MVLKSPGTNCDVETAFAFEQQGTQVEKLHVNNLIKNPAKIGEFQILAVPGGFSFGDDIASGKVLANKLSFSLEEQMKNFIEEDKLVLGICNGFQVLVKARLLPGFEAIDLTQQATLTYNDSGKFEDRWVRLKKVSDNCIFTKGIDFLDVPIRHGEGKFVSGQRALAKLKENNQIAFKYVGEKNEENPAYPFNPNGSVDGIAGICNIQGNVLGLMPHPEAFLFAHNHPRFLRKEATQGAGAKIFENAARFAEEALV